MYVLDDDCAARKINVHNGHVVWFKKLGNLCAASPAVASQAGVVLMSVLSVQGHSPGGGRFVALSIKNGKIVWSRPDGAGTETSPIVSNTTVYYGDQGGNLYSRNAKNGHLYWAYHASGAIKGGPALVNGILYFGDYAGRVYALSTAGSILGTFLPVFWFIPTYGTRPTLEGFGLVLVGVSVAGLWPRNRRWQRKPACKCWSAAGTPWPETSAI